MALICLLAHNFVLNQHLPLELACGTSRGINPLLAVGSPYRCLSGGEGWPVFADTCRVAPREREQSPIYSQHLPNVEPESWSADLQGGEVGREGDDEGRTRATSRFIPLKSSRRLRGPHRCCDRPVDGRWAALRRFSSRIMHVRLDACPESDGCATG